MATVAVQKPHDVPTTLNYYAPIGDEKPYIYVAAPPGDKLQANIGSDPRPVIIHDVRGKEDTVSLDTTGFQFVKHKSQEKEFDDEERITTVYYKEVEELLKSVTGAKRVVIFDHTIRRNYPDKPFDSTDRTRNIRAPVEQVHIDQTFQASIARVHRHTGADAERLLKGRVRIINVWRPIGHPVAHKPLAVADYRTLDAQSDLIHVRFIYPDREGSTFSVRYNDKNQLQWHYLSAQTPEEVTLIKCFDSDETKARLTPHSAFLDPTDSPDLPKRQSIEIRTLVFDEE